jgi:transposase InsO family protein
MNKIDRRFSVGSKFELDGENHTVISLDGFSLTARSNLGRISSFQISGLFNRSTFRFGKDANNLVDLDTSMFTDAQLKPARQKLGHLLEAITGFKSGTHEIAEPDEPLHIYDSERHSLNQRLTSKAEELKWSRSKIFRKKKAFEAYGLVGLVDGRVARQGRVRVDDRVVQAIGQVLDGDVDKSTTNFTTFSRRLEKQVKINHPGVDIDFPPPTTLRRLVQAKKHGKYFVPSAKQRRNNALRPEKPYSHFYATRPGEMVLIDTTPLDAFAMDPYTFMWVPVQLTIALDLYSRSIIAWRFTPQTTQGVDAAFLLFDLLRPKLMRLGWDESVRWAYAGIPENIIIETHGDPDKPSPLAALPFLNPQSVVIDNGKVFISETFMDACRLLGINVYLARPYTPTDKAHVERLFRTIRESFVIALPGYKGPDIFSRGKDVENDAFYFIDEIEEKFAFWVAKYYQNHLHGGLEFPTLPAMKISPNHMLEEGIARAGFVFAPPNPNLFFELLPTVWRTIQHYGVEIDGLIYDGEILNEYRNKKSEFAGVRQGKWRFKKDPRDISAIYFLDPDSEIWHTLRWHGGEHHLRPFTSKTLSYAKALVIQRGLDPSSPQDLQKVINDWLNQIEDNAVLGKAERRKAALQVMQTSAAKKDRQTAPGEDVVTSTPTAPEPELPDSQSELIRALKGETADAEKIISRALRTVDEALEDDDDDLVI